MAAMARKTKKSSRVQGGVLPPSLQRRLERAWDAYDEDDLESAGLEAAKLLDESDGHPEVRLLLAAVRLEEGNPGIALEELERCRDEVEDAVSWSYYRASALFDLLRFADAEEEFRRALEGDPDWAPSLYGLAETLEHLLRRDEAEMMYLRAAEIDPRNYPPPVRMAREEFEKAVDEAVAEMPEDLRRRLRQVAVVVADLPTADVLATADGGAPLSPGVLGLFVGPSINEMGSFSVVTYPPTIFIYQRNLERYCRTRRQLVEEIALTLDHELGHFLGLNEEELAERGLQ